jgi:hypothetical protein
MIDPNASRVGQNYPPHAIGAAHSILIIVKIF